MPHMYILKCVDDSYYTGSTWNLQKRLAEHQRGEGARHTAKRLPVELVYCEEYDRVEDAFNREKQVQGWSRKKKEALMAGDTNGLHLLAECRNGSHWAGFDSAQPAGSGRSLSEAEGKRPGSGGAGFDYAQPAASAQLAGDSNSRSLSEAEGNGLSCGDAGFDSAQPALHSARPAAEASRSQSEAEGDDAQAQGGSKNA